MFSDQRHKFGMTVIFRFHANGGIVTKIPIRQEAFREARHRFVQFVSSADSKAFDVIVPVLPRNLRPMRLSRRSEPFDSDDFIYELKIDGFRALAHLQDGRGELISRNGNVFRGFADLATWSAEHLPAESSVLDGEIACIDEAGHPNFRD